MQIDSLDQLFTDDADWGAEQELLGRVHDAAARVLPPDRAHRGFSAWLESEARALVRHAGEREGRAEIRRALRAAGVGDILLCDDE